MKTWIVKYYWRGKFGSYDEQCYVIVAPTSERAIELARLESGQKDEKNWTSEEIDTTEENSVWVSSNIN